MSHYRDILSALQKLKAGAGKLTTEQYVDVLEAIEQAAQALYSAPRGADPAAMGVWWNHERTPALARLADTLSHTNRSSRSSWELKTAGWHTL